MAFSKLEKAMALVIGLDIAAPGFSRAAAKAAVGAIGRVTPPLARAAATTTTGLAAANPALTGAALGLGALQTQPGQELLDMAAERGRMDRIRFEQALTDLTVSAGKRKTKTKSKSSTSFGKKNVINNPKKAFAAVTKTASSVKKTGKVAKSGIRRKIGLAIRRIL